ncbi:alpha-xylosidase BoGH31A [Abditibacteriota bacterium]|nr:alpha-xylosidase BoGH31A [Abditibacteriota bacterium]
MRNIKFNRRVAGLYRLCIAGLLVTGATATRVLAAPVTPKQVQQAPNGVTLSLAKGWLRLQVCTPSVIHVSYSPTSTFPEQKVPTVIGHFAPVRFKVTSSPQSIKVTTAQIQAEVNRTSGTVRFLDSKGASILSEATDSRSLTPTTLPGATAAASFITRQNFVMSPDEAIYGLGQHQDRQGGAGKFATLAYQGTNVSLQQDYITNLAIPFLVSSRGYGLLWNNPASTTVGIGVGSETVIPSAPLYTETGQAGGLTGQYFNGINFDTLVATRTDPQIDFNWATPPEGLPHDHYSVRWTGFLQAQQEGDYTLATSSDDGVRLWVDDKQVIDNWTVHALTTNEAALHFAANSRHKIRLEFYQDQFDSVVRLSWRTKPQNPVVSWSSEAGDGIDYYFFYGPSLDGVMSGYRQATGQVPMPPKWALGFWQSKERYSSQQELIDIAEGYRSRHEPLDNIVQDWRYWDPFVWGTHQFDPKRYPDMAAGIKDLHDKQHVQLMISVWAKFNPGTPDNPNPNYDALNAKGFLYPALGGSDHFYDAFSPGARQLYWQQMRDQLFAKGIDAWWLDASEPEVDLNQFRGVPTGAGPAATVMNAWPLMHTTAVYQGQRAAAPNQRVFILTRSAYAGEQRNAATIWSSDITASWQTFAHQIPVGLNMGLSSIPYWATDTGGFFCPYPGGSQNPQYRELFTRWFQWSAFTPIFRVHGTDTPKELWRFGPEHEPILVKYDNLRYRLMPYIYSQAWQVSHQAGTMMRALVMDFPGDKTARELSDEYLFGPSILVCPVTTQGATSRSVYLPGNTQWTDFWTGRSTQSGQTVTASAPLDTLPLYVKAGSILPMGPMLQYVAEKPADPIELRVYPGADGTFTLYEDEGVNTNYEKGQYATIPFSWNEKNRTLTIGERRGAFQGMLQSRTFNVTLVKPGVGVGLDSSQTSAKITYTGKRVAVTL